MHIIIIFVINIITIIIYLFLKFKIWRGFNLTKLISRLHAHFLRGWSRGRNSLSSHYILL